MFPLRSAAIQDLSYCDEGRHAALPGCFLQWIACG